MSFQLFGIDVSHWQGDFDFAAAVESDNIKFAILKAGGNEGGTYEDSKFDAYYEDAKAAGLYVGSYYFGGATSTDEAVEEADHFASILSGKQFELPVYYDVEASCMLSLSKATLTKVVKAFCDRMEELGYFVGIYMSKSYFSSKVNDDDLADYAHWVAQWASECTYSGTYGMWQFGGSTNYLRSAQINGTTVDQDYMVEDYPTTITTKGFNGYSASSSSTSSSSSSNTSYVTGAKVTLSNAPLYASSTTSTVANSVTGTYYIWNSTVKNSRIRITTKASYCGVSGQVTGWVAVSALNKTSTAADEDDDYDEGDKVALSSVSLYATATTSKVANTLTGTYYIWNGYIKNDRIRITNKKANCGVDGQVTGWVKVSDLG